MKLSKEAQWIIGIIVIVLVMKSQGWIGAAYAPQTNMETESIYVDKEYPETNFDTADYLKIGINKHTYIKFVSLSDKQIDYGKICLNVYEMNVPGQVQLYTIPSDWTYKVMINDTSSVTYDLDWNHRFKLEHEIGSIHITQTGIVCEEFTGFLQDKGEISLALQSNIAEVTLNKNKNYLWLQYQDRPLLQPVCGNKIIELLEECDDGNNIDDDGCSATCIMECKWYEKKENRVCSFNNMYYGGIGIVALLLILAYRKKIMGLVR